MTIRFWLIHEWKGFAGFVVLEELVGFELEGLVGLVGLVGILALGELVGLVGILGLVGFAEYMKNSK